MFWIPYASNNRASMFELIKNFLSPITTLNGQIIEPGDEEVESGAHYSIIPAGKFSLFHYSSKKELFR